MRNEKNNYLWITWEKQRRNRTLSEALCARLEEIIIERGFFLRYPLSVIRTLLLIIKHKPDVLFVQNPSIVLAATALLYHKITGLPLIVDAHNAGVFPTEGRDSLLNSIAKYILRSTPVTIVSNDNLAKYITSLKGNAVVLPDPVPKFSSNHPVTNLQCQFNAFFICTWADDEPYENVIKASRMVDEDTCIYISGNSKDKELPFGPLPDNIILTGFLSDTDFISILFSCDLVIDLTTRNDCLVCGAYESLAAEKPFLLSDSRALRDYFGTCALYTDNTATDIAAKISYAKKEKASLQSKTVKSLESINHKWDYKFSELLNTLNKLHKTRPNDYS